MFKTVKKVSVGSAKLVNNLRGGDDYVQRRVNKTFLSTRERRMLAEAGMLAAANDLIPVPGAEVSYRVEGERMAVSVDGADISNLEDYDILICPIVPSKPATRAGKMLDWHRAILNNTEYNLILFCQPMHAVLAMGARLEIDDRWLHGLTDEIGGVTTIDLEAGPGGIAEIADSNQVIMVPRQGVFVFGVSVEDVISRARFCSSSPRAWLLLPKAIT